MFGTIRRHQTWLWVVVAGVTIVSFVIFGPTNSRLGNVTGNDRGANGSLAGHPITQAQYASAQKEVYLNYFLENNQWPNHTADLKQGFIEAREIYVRLFLIQKQKDLGIEISSDAIVNRARQMLGSMPADEFVGKILAPEGLNYDDFERYIRHNLGIQQLFMTAAMSGSLVTPQEAETLYRNEHRDLATAAVFFSASNYLADVSANPTELAQFYTNRMAAYRIPNRIEVNYVKYNVTNYLAGAQKELTNVDQIIDGDERYKKYATNAESRTTLKQEIIRGHALQAANKDANAFAVELYDMPAGTNRVGNLEELAKKKGLTVHTTAPFDSEQGPQDINVSPNFIHSAFKLSPDEPFSGPVPAEDGVYVLALKRTIPSEVPPLKSIEAKVTKDYRNAKATQMAQQAAMKFDATLTNSLAQGKTFTAIATEAGVKTQSLPPFSLSTRSLPPEIEDRLDFGMLKQVAFSTPVGKASRPAPTRDGAYILYIEKQLPIDEAKLKKELPGFITYVRQSRQGDAFNQWLGKQINQDPSFAQLLQKTVEDAQMRSSSARLPKS